MTVSGRCECGSVRFEADDVRDTVNFCHCGQCRKQTGLYYAATDTLDANININDSGSLKWYAASDIAKRGFCSECGSALFWKANGTDKTSILAGSLDGDTSGIKLERHIFTSDKGGFYDINDGLKQYDQGDRHDPRPDPNG